MGHTLNSPPVNQCFPKVPTHVSRMHKLGECKRHLCCSLNAKVCFIFATKCSEGRFSRCPCMRLKLRKMSARENKMEPRQAGNTFGRHERRLVSKRHLNMSERMARLRNWCISNAIHLSQLLPQPSAVPTAVGGGSSVVPETSVGRG